MADPAESQARSAKVRALHVALNRPGEACRNGMWAFVMLEFLILLYAAAVGFVAAGIVSSFRQMINAEPPQFKMAGERWTILLASLAYFAFTGPVLVSRAIVSGRPGEPRSLGWALAGITVVGLWSCCLGLIVLQVILVLVSLNA